jgi:predicted CopG family antitoxin
MAYKKLIKIGPDVDAKLIELKKEFGLQSHNKVLRRLLGLTKDGRDDKS